MNTTQRLLAEAKSALNIQSDYALAKALGITRQAISLYQTGRRQLADNETVFRLADVLGRDPAMIIAELEVGKATRPETREAWIQRLKQLGGVAATVVITTSGALPAPGNAAVAAHDNGACDRQPLTVFRTRRAYAARCRSAMSSLLGGFFQQLRRPAFAAPALT